MAKQRKFPKGRRQCSFCGGFNVSKEHVFPDWLKKLFPRDKTTVHTAADISWPANLITKEPSIIRRVRQGHVGTLKVRAVCETCNSGWMSILEKRVQPVLVPLIAGKRANLSTEAQLLLSAWAAKTSMTAEYLRPRERGVTPEERSWLKQHQIPPINWFVWIGAYSGTAWRNLSIYQTRGRLDESPVAGPDRARHYVQATTFGVGHIAFLTVSSSWRHIGQKFAGHMADGLPQIWPPLLPQSILWPPQRILGDPQVNAMANVLGLSKAFDHSFDPGANWTFTF